jgi:hypothetical protein
MPTQSDPHQFAVEKIFPPEKLTQFNTSALVKSLDPNDFADLAKEFSIPPVKTSNPKLAKLTSQDLVSIEGLFQDYRSSIVANFRGVHDAPTLHKVAASSSCCCCCTPCCSCCSAATQMEPFGE